MSTINSNTALQILRSELQEIESRILEGQVTYDPHRRKGRGSFGEVYLGQHEGTNVCVKVLSLEGAALELKRWEKFLRVLKREVKVWRSLDNPNVVPFIGWMSEERKGEVRVSLISSWCDGGNVKDYLREHSSADRHGLICGVSRGLAYLHSEDIVHGDIKPANIVVARRGKASGDAQLCDFGLSCILGDATTYANSSSISASCRYASPELLNASENRRTRESDIWAFGCASAEILTERLPFSWVINEWKIPSVADSQLPFDRKDDDGFWKHIKTCFERVPTKRPSMDKLGTNLELASGHSDPLTAVRSSSPTIVTLRLLLHLRQLDNLPSSWRYRLNDDIPGLADAYGKLVPANVQTACRGWCDAVCEFPGGDAEVESGVDGVIPILLHWVAAMGIMGEVEKALEGLYKLGEWVWDGGLKEVLYDLHRMMLQSRTAIEACSLSVLGDSHPFIPRGSTLRSRFPGTFSGDILGVIAPGFTELDVNWPPLLTELEHLAPIGSVTFSPDGYYLASASRDKLIRIWCMATGMISRVLDGHTHWVTSIVFSSDSRYLASASYDKSVQIWDVDTRKTSRVLNGHTHPVTSVAFSPDTRSLASASTDASVRIWDVDTGVTSRVLTGHTHLVTSVAFSPHGRYLASASGDMSLRIWDLDTGMTSHVLRGHSDWVTSVIFSPNSRYLASASDDASLRIWEVDTGMTSRVLNGHTHYVTSVAFSPDGRYLASASDDRSLRIWDMDTGMSSPVVNGHTGWVTSIAFSPHGRYLASASDDRSVRIWDVDTGLTSHVFNGHTHWVTAVALSPDGCYLASASGDRSLRIWDVTNGMTSRVLDGHTSWVTSVAFSPDSRYLASASHDESIRVWGVTTGTTSQVLNGHTSEVSSITFSPDSCSLASTSHDKSVRIWDLITSTLVSRDFSPLYYPHDPVFSSDGAYVSVSLRASDKSQETRRLNASTLQDTTPSQPRSSVSSTSLGSFSNIVLKDQSLCVQRGGTTMHLCWLPNHISVSTPIVQSGNTVCFGAHGGEVIIADLSHFRLPEV